MSLLATPYCVNGETSMGSNDIKTIPTVLNNILSLAKWRDEYGSKNMMTIPTVIIIIIYYSYVNGEMSIVSKNMKTFGTVHKNILPL